ncbi:MAG: hypothetical protein R3A52_23350 [Polyangiales bacterium]
MTPGASTTCSIGALATRSLLTHAAARRARRGDREEERVVEAAREGEGHDGERAEQRRTDSATRNGRS